jgi:hypothetical protein
MCATNLHLPVELLWTIASWGAPKDACAMAKSCRALRFMLKDIDLFVLIVHRVNPSRHAALLRLAMAAPLRDVRGVVQRSIAATRASDGRFDLDELALCITRQRGGGQESARRREAFSLLGAVICSHRRSEQLERTTAIIAALADAGANTSDAEVWRYPCTQSANCYHRETPLRAVAMIASAVDAGHLFRALLAKPFLVATNQTSRRSIEDLLGAVRIMHHEISELREKNAATRLERAQRRHFIKCAEDAIHVLDARVVVHLARAAARLSSQSS